MPIRGRLLLVALLGGVPGSAGCGDKGGDSGAPDGGSGDGGAHDGGGGDGGAGCGPGTDDQDCDGVTAEADCDDLDGGSYPGATEVCGDDRDEDCDGVAAPCAPAGVMDPRDGVRLLAPEPGGFGGYAVAALADIDGDGVGELWASASRASGTAVRGGVAYLVPGPVAEGSSLADAVLELRGGERDWLGTALAGGADLDGDGVADLVAGAPGDQILEPGSTLGAGPGRVVVVSGLDTGTRDVDDARALLLGEEDGDKAGCDVAVADDLDGDGVGDLLVGAYLQDGGAEAGGAAYVVAGPLTGTRSLADADGRLLGGEAYEQAGASVSAIGDVTGDGTADLLIGADGDEGGLAGRAYVVAGPVTGDGVLADRAVAVIGSDEVGDNLASTALGGVDLDGDLVPDYLLCAYDAGEGTPSPGVAYLVSGPVSGTVQVQTDARTTIQGVAGMGHFAEACAVVGDVDHDGRADVLIGAHEHGVELEGRAYLFYDLPEGEVAAEDASAIFVGPTPDEDLGWAVGGGRDLTGDGFADVVIGARKASETADMQGAVYVGPGGIGEP